MSTVLPVDTDLVFPSYTVVSASAGSGKTHTLTQRFVQLLLSDSVPKNSLRNILAITFTNQAATEMRQRLIGYLKRLCLGDENTLAEARELLSMGDERLKEKAEVVLARILDEYADLQIRTIDSFMATIFKTSSFEFGYRPDLDIIFDNREIVSEAFEQLMREVTGRPELRRVLNNLVDLINETRHKSSPFLWDPYSRIQWEVRKLYSQLASHEKEVIPGGGLEEGAEIRERLKRTAREFQKAITDSGMTIQKHLDSDLQLVATGHPESVIGRTKKGPDKIVRKPRGGIGEKQYTRGMPILEKKLEEYNQQVDEYILWQSRNYYQPYIDAIFLVRKALFDLKRHKGQILIDDINKTIRPLLRDAVADAYLMLGDQIYHFLIDEFQDTSPIQWANLFPLIENSLSQGGSLFVVGDTRQSIYVFRNADWRIMDRLMKGNEFPSARKSVIPLQKNWRSYEEITRYTGHVFETNVKNSEVANDAALSGLLNVRQEVLEEHKRKGVVEVTTMTWEEEERPERKEILRLVSDCLARGYSERDIAIVTQTNERVLDVGGWLNEGGWRVLPFSSLDIRSRKIVGELIALLHFLDAPIDDLSFSSFLLGDIFAANLRADESPLSGNDLHALLFISAHGESPKRHAYKRFQELHPEVWKRYFEELYRFVGYLPLYDLLSEIYRSFRVFDLVKEEEASLVRLLEIAKEFSESDRNSLRDFLSTAKEEGETTTWQVQVPREVEAVRVMTIHKAKGLEFTVVLVLLYDRDERTSNYFFKEEPGGVRLMWIRQEMAKRIPFLATLYEEQREKGSVDNLNKLYVSLTRAKQEMFVLAVEGERTKLPSALLTPAESRLPLRPPAEIPPPMKVNILNLDHRYGRVRYDEPSAEPMGFVETERGRFVHAILSQIECIEGDIEQTVDLLAKQLAPSALLPLDLDEIRTTLLAFLRDKSVTPLFDKVEGRMVYREREFAGSDGSLLRMDRVIVDRDAVTVVDFKTGTGRKPGVYEPQVRAYLDVIADLYPQLTRRGVLAFVDQRRVETVA